LKPAPEKERKKSDRASNPGGRTGKKNKPQSQERAICALHQKLTLRQEKPGGEKKNHGVRESLEG